MVAVRKERSDESHELPTTVWLTPEESCRQFDEYARERVCMTGDEFIRKLQAGDFLEIPDDEEHRAYVELAPMSGVVR